MKTTVWVWRDRRGSSLNLYRSNRGTIGYVVSMVDLLLSRTFRVTHLKGTVTHLKGTVKRKQLSRDEKRHVSRRALSLSSSSPLPQFHSFGVSLHCTSHPSGSRSSVKRFIHDPFPHCGTRKSSAPCRIQSIYASLVVINQPLRGLRHGQ